MLDSFFKLSENGTDVRTEFLAGVTTFLTMAYIVFVNPAILKITGMDAGAVLVATCLAAAVGTAIMGLYANYPFALAPGMGLNAYFTFGVVQGMGHSWQVALGAVFISGIIFVIISVTPIREWVINAIPRSLKMAISAGIGLFLGIIAMESAGLTVDHPATLVTLGDLTSPTVLLAVAGFFAMVILSALRIPGAMIIAILGVTFLGVVLGITEPKGIFSAPPSLAPTFLQMDIVGALDIGLFTIVFAFLFVDFFDTAGTLIGLAHRGGMLDADGRLPRLRKALLADSTATALGAAFGTSSTTSYIESASGINAGGRTGLTAMVVAVLFLLCLFLSPLAETIPSYATAPALMFVVCLMARGLAEINWDDITDVAPAVVTALAMPLTYSIANGIGFGFVTYAVVKLVSGRGKEVHPAVFVLALLFVAKYAFLGG